MQLDAPARRARSRLTQAAVMVRGSNVRDALPEVDIFPREAGRLAGPSTVPAEEEDEAQERWMLAPRELPLEGSAREPFGDLLPFFRCQRSGGWRVESFPLSPTKGSRSRRSCTIASRNIARSDPLMMQWTLFSLSGSPLRRDTWARSRA